MKILDLMKKWWIGGNTKVIVRDTAMGKIYELSTQNIKELSPREAMQLTVDSLWAHDNVVTIYAHPGKVVGA